MKIPTNTLEIRTLGGFGLMVGEKTITATWPDEISKELFCTLLSPLDKSITMERLCRSLWNLPASRTPKMRIAAKIDHLSDIFVAETGINPFIIDKDRVRINSGRVRVDAHEFHRHVAEGLKQLLLGNRPAFLIKFHEADLLYRGPFMPGMFNKVITTTREDLDETHRMVVKRTVPIARPPWQIDRGKMAESTITMMAA